MTWGRVQNPPSWYFRKYHIIAVKKLMGDSTKKSPCLLIHSRLSPINIVRADSAASVISDMVSWSRGLQRWLRVRSSKLITKNSGCTTYLSLYFSQVL